MSASEVCTCLSYPSLQAYDLVLWGDSLTADMRDWREQAWDEYFPRDELLTQPLGMGGSTVQVNMSGLCCTRSQPAVAATAAAAAAAALASAAYAALCRHTMCRHTMCRNMCSKCVPQLAPDGMTAAGSPLPQELAARIIKDGERPDIDPKAVVLWVGTNNVKNPNAKNANPADKLDWWAACCTVASFKSAAQCLDGCMACLADVDRRTSRVGGDIPLQLLARAGAAGACAPHRCTQWWHAPSPSPSPSPSSG